MPTKLCAHAFTAHAAVRQFVEAGAPLVKLVNDFDSAAEYLSLNPNLTLLGRLAEAFDANQVARSGTPPQQAARAFVEHQRPTYQQHPLIKIWEGPHEPRFGHATEATNMRAIEWYGAFETERLRLLADLGLRGIVGNFATGTPDLPMWSAFLPAVDAAEQYNGFLGVHEYSSPWLWWLTGKQQTNNCEAAADTPDEGDTGWHTLRYRKVYRQFLEPNGLGQVPLLITECGLDRVGAVCPGMTSGPWSEHLDFWARHTGAQDPIDYWRANPERDPERYYAEQLMWYDRELQKDAYVQGAAIFTVGGPGSWERYDIGERRITNVLLDHIRAQRLIATASPKATPSLIVPPGDAAPKRAATPNLLINASFEDGQTYPADDTRERMVPSGWYFEYLDANTAREPGQTDAWGQPITALINNRAVLPADKARIFAGGVYCWKIAGTAAPTWVRLHQGAHGLQAGQKYRFTVNVLPDLIVQTHPQMAYASDPRASEIRLAAKAGEKVFDTDWRNLTTTPAGHYTRLTLDFTAPTERAEVIVEVRGRWAMPLGAWYVDELSLMTNDK